MQKLIIDKTPVGKTDMVRPRWENAVILSVLVAAAVAIVVIAVGIINKYIAEIWASGFVAAILIGGAAFCAKETGLWVCKNVIVRRMCCTMFLSRENKEAAPVLEWFKVWLPRHMQKRNEEFHNVAPLFRKRDGRAFFVHMQDVRSKALFSLSYWIAPGTHSFAFTALDGRRVRILLHYYTTGDVKRTGWDNELVAQEHIDMYMVDILGTRLQIFKELLEQAQEVFANREANTVRFQSWTGWKGMWDSTSADESVAYTLPIFYELSLIDRLNEEIRVFLDTPNDELLELGLSLKLGLLLHGPPGTGKTNLVRYIASKYDMQINMVDMNSGETNNNALIESINTASGIVLIEDIDNVPAARGVREMNVSGERAKTVTLDGLLNALDGVQRGATKRIVIATTNYPERLVPALRRRGRLGLSYEITYASDEVLARILRSCLTAIGANTVQKTVRRLEAEYHTHIPTSALVGIVGKARLGCIDARHTIAFMGEETRRVLKELTQISKRTFATSAELLEYLQISEETTSEASPKSYRDAFAHAACTEIDVCTHLSHDMLRDDLKIQKVGHRIRILEQLKCV